mgnify:CR=1 FL=1
MLKGLDERIASIYSPVRQQLNQVEVRLRGLAQTDAPYLEPLLDYVLASGGKRIRPAITLLASEFYPHHSEASIAMASAVASITLSPVVP